MPHHFIVRRFAQLVLVITLFTNSLSIASAATEWEAALADINNLHSNYTTLQDDLKTNSSNIQKLRKLNNDKLKSILATIAATDKPLLERLSAELISTKKKHAPLLEQYSKLSKQSTEAKKAKDLKTVTLLDLKRNKLKPAVAIARSEISHKTAVLSAARKVTATKLKPAKDALVPISVLKKQITAENKKVIASNKLRSEADKLYKAAVKQGDAINAAAELKSSYEHMVNIQAMYHNIYSWEVKLELALRTAESKLP